MSGDASNAQRLVELLVVRLGKARAHQALDLVLDKFSVTELAALAFDWRDVWARPKQLPPQGPWRSWGFLCGRGFGKTRSVAEHINEEVRDGRALRLGLAAQNEDKCEEIQVFGESGLIATAPPWFRPEWVATDKQLVWPNGAIAQVLTPEAPGGIRGPEFHLFWATEFQSWPEATRWEAYTNALFATRLGYSRMVWDATPKKGHPILLDRLRLAERDPARHLIVRGTTRENAVNLGAGVIDDLEAQFLGTTKGREELLGEMSTEAEGALFRSALFVRVPRPASFTYRVVAVDPAVTSRKGSDTTGIVTAGLMRDGRAMVERDDSGKLDVAKWGSIVLDRYEEGCDLVLAETNKGGDLVVQNLRALAKERGLRVVVVGKTDRPTRLEGTVFVKEIFARGAKDERAQPVVTAYERRRVVHCSDANLESLEQTLTTWEPSPSATSPGDLDALVHGVGELLGLSGATTEDGRAAFAGLEQAARELGIATSAGGGDIATLLRGGGGRI